MELVVDYKNFKKGSLTQERIDEFKEIAKRMGCRFVLKNAPTLNYDCSIWLDENNEVCGANFHTKKEALDYASEGKISCIAECNPLHGPRVRSLIEMLVNGENPDKFNYVDEKLFSSCKLVKEVVVEGTSYQVQNIGKNN